MVGPPGSLTTFSGRRTAPLLRYKHCSLLETTAKEFQGPCKILLTPSLQRSSGISKDCCPMVPPHARSTRQEAVTIYKHPGTVLVQYQYRTTFFTAFQVFSRAILEYKYHFQLGTCGGFDCPPISSTPGVVPNHTTTTVSWCNNNTLHTKRIPHLHPRALTHTQTVHNVFILQMFNRSLSRN